MHIGCEIPRRNRASACKSFFFLMIRRPPRSTLDRSSAASDVYKRQPLGHGRDERGRLQMVDYKRILQLRAEGVSQRGIADALGCSRNTAVSYTHLRAHETVLVLVCRLLLETKKNNR